MAGLQSGASPRCPRFNFELLDRIRSMPLKPRDLIIDNFDREGIVVERARRPTASWLADQEDVRVRELPADTVWLQ